MNAKQLNAQALLNNITGYIEMLTNTKATMKAVVKDWNVCIEQSGADFLTFDFPVEGWTRKATLIAEFERVAVQLTNIMEGRDALEAAPERHETMVQDIKRGDVVVNPVSGELNTVTGVDDFSCYFIILFSGDMVQQYFDRGETLMVCEAKPATQINNVSTTPEALNMTTETITTEQALEIINAPRTKAQVKAGHVFKYINDYYWMDADRVLINRHGLSSPDIIDPTAPVSYIGTAATYHDAALIIANDVEQTLAN